MLSMRDSLISSRSTRGLRPLSKVSLRLWKRPKPSYDRSDSQPYAAGSHIRRRKEERCEAVESSRGFISDKRGVSLETRFTVDAKGSFKIHTANFEFDDAAYKSARRQEEVHGLKTIEDQKPEEIEAESEVIVYISLPGDGSIGTLDNGAGLAMNTVDALADHGGKCVNFLDTGGKATSETIRSSFRIILKDLRVKAILVNIFGGLIRCDVIADGIILAFKDLSMDIPVVVRLKGTNEELGQQKIADSGLALHAIDDFEAAAKRVIELASGDTNA